MAQISWIRAVAALFAATLFTIYSGAFGDATNFFSASAGACATLLGFLIAALAMLTASLDRQLIANMRKTGHYGHLVAGVQHCCLALLLALTVSLFALLLSGAAKTYGCALLVGLDTYCLLYIASLGYQLSLVVKYLS